MKKHVKMILYGFPEDGKSTFASHAPAPFFIATDGNVEWLTNITEKNYVIVNSWEKAKATFTLLAKPEYNWVETIVVDLAEDLFKWCESEYCKRNRIDHVSDQAYGKAYDSTRSDYVNELGRLIALPKNVILIMHASEVTYKDRRGVEHTKYTPTNKLPDKVLDSLEGKMRYVLRCYRQAEEDEEGRLRTRRYLSLVPKENEFGIARGIDEELVPHDIPLDWDTFAQVIGLDDDYAERQQTEHQKMIDQVAEVKAAPIIKKPEVLTKAAPKAVASANVSKPVEKEIVNTVTGSETQKEKNDAAVATEPVSEKTTESLEPKPNPKSREQILAEARAKVSGNTIKAATEAIAKAEEEPHVEPTVVENVEAEKPKTEMSSSDVLSKLAALKAKVKK